MAIDEEIITNFITTAGRHYTSELPSYLECSICTNVLHDPVCCESGAHTFCRKCLTDWSTRSVRPVCPIDREELGRGEDRPRRAPRALQECIDALEVLCALGKSIAPVSVSISLLVHSIACTLIRFCHTFVMQAADGQVHNLNGQIISDVTVQRSKETTMRLANEGLGACH